MPDGFSGFCRFCSNCNWISLLLSILFSPKFETFKATDCCINNRYISSMLMTPYYFVGKVIQMNQLDATMIYWSIRSAQHVSGNILPIIRSVRLRYLQHTAYSTHSATLPLTVSLPTTNNRIPYAVKISVSGSWWWAKYCPKHVELIL